MRVAIWTFGCRLNFAETEELIELLNKKRFDISFKKPQIIIIRGCSVTKKAEKETRIKINKLRKKGKRTLIIAAGCLRKNFYCPSADLIFFKQKEGEILKKLENFRDQNLKNLPQAPVEKLPKLRTRSFIKIQDGCENYCAYCLVPFLRGKEKSKPENEIIKKIKEKEKNGYQEIVLTGVNIGKWKEGKKDFIWLVKKILAETKIPRIRISSLWPDVLDKKFITLFKNRRLCRHLHLSLQSLSQSVLKRMNRSYRVKNIKEKIKKIKFFLPDLSISADLIVGFPGETEEEFKKTVENVKKIGLAKIHVFRYSPRENTTAALMKNQVKDNVKKRRSNILISLSKRLNKKWRKNFISQTREILFEQKKDAFWRGLTDNYLKVYLSGEDDYGNKILSVKIIKIYQDGLLGKI